MSREPIFNWHIAGPLIIMIAMMSGLSWGLHWLASLNQDLFLATVLPAVALIIIVGGLVELRHRRRSRQEAQSPDLPALQPPSSHRGG
jgi:hypothetical protein